MELDYGTDAEDFKWSKRLEKRQLCQGAILLLGKMNKPVRRIGLTCQRKHTLCSCPNAIKQVFSCCRIQSRTQIDINLQ
jgi:hypothetical protein